MIVMHLPSMGHHGHLERFGQGGYFSRLADASHAIGIELNVIESIVLEEFTKAKDCKFMLSACDGDAAVVFQLLVTACVVWNHRLLYPAKMEWLQKGQHAL